MAERRAIELLAAELGLPAASVDAALALLEQGATAPFIARYRQERTGGLREEQVRSVARLRRRLESLERRKGKILEQIARHSVLTDEVRQQVGECLSRAELEDLYLPHRPRRRTRGTLAKERGLEPLATALRDATADGPSLVAMAAPYVNAQGGVSDHEAALEGARHILAEQIAEHPAARKRLRQRFADTGVLRSTVVEGKAGEHSKYEMYYDFAEPVRSIPPHRILAIRRGEKEGWLTVRVEVEREGALAALHEAYAVHRDSPAAAAVERAMADAWDRLLAPSLESEVRAGLKRCADDEAISVFTRNLRGLLLQPPAGPRRTLGVQPGYRTGCKLAAVDEQGKLLEHATVFPHPPQAQAAEARAAVRALVDKHGLEAVAIGSGTASRETELFFRQLLKEVPDRKVVRMVVNDAGASTYATSRAAREEFPDLDPGLRCAVSMARRFQDPLAELVQVDPKAIGVGQYQHDVNQQALREALEEAVESCVTAVGVDVARATAAHLSYVAGLDRAAAHELVRWRDEHGPPRTRADLLAVPHFDELRCQQAAAFLRIGGGDQPLDATAIHPERYELVARIASDAGTDVATLLGNRELVRRIDFARYATDEVARPTLDAIRRELLHPGRGPRKPFRCVQFRDDISAVEDMQPGMVLEGTVTNVTNFGAFVDIGVHEDGLVHVSELAHRYVRDPNEAVQVGDIVKVKVLSVDTERRRIGLSIKQAVPPPKPKPKPREAKAPRPKPRKRPTPKKPKRDPRSPATAEDIARLIAHFQSR